MTNGFRDSYGEHSHRKTRPVINVSLITLTFLQVDFHTYPIILPCLCSSSQTAAMCCRLISPGVIMLLSMSAIVHSKCSESCNVNVWLMQMTTNTFPTHLPLVVCSYMASFNFISPGFDMHAVQHLQAGVFLWAMCNQMAVTDGHKTQVMFIKHRKIVKSHLYFSL